MKHGSAFGQIPVGALVAALIAGAASGATPAEQPAVDYRADAGEVAGLIAANYAYLDHLPGGAVPSSAKLDAERDAVHDDDSLLRYAEDMMTALADHHAMTGSSFRDDWAIVPTYADLWIVRRGGAYVIDAVKPDTPAARAGIVAGDRLVAVDGVATQQAVATFWDRLGLAPEGERGPFAARILAAGRRDRDRRLTIAGATGQRSLTLASLYRERQDRPPVTVIPGKAGAVTIRFNNALGDSATITAFDHAMAALPDRAPVTIDISDVPSGGTTSVARAIMGWFVTRPMPYQVHDLPAEARETGIPRRWIEEVLPRPGKHHVGPVRVVAGRWTGSVGEALAIGFQSLGRPVCGSAMAGLKGAVYDFDLPRSGLRIKFPAERLYAVDGRPRETVALPACRG